MQRIGLMGGSFNPIHNGHLNMARAALDGGFVDRVLFLPSGDPPHKRQGVVDKAHRLAMVELAAEGFDRADVCRMEIEREGKTYTVDTLTQLTSEHPDERYVYLIGADTLVTLHTWRRPEDVVRLCALLVAQRPGEDNAALMQAAAYWRARGAQIDFMPIEPMDVSSTQIRALAANGESLEGLVPAAVGAYIRAHGLYDAKEDQAR